MLVIEGADCLGKTTAAKRLAEMMGVEYRHMGRPGPKFGFTAAEYLSMYHEGVQDRFHLGGLIWHGVSQTGLTGRKLREVDSALYARGVFTVVMRHADSNVYDHMLRRSAKRELFDRDTIISANERYHTLVRHSRPREASANGGVHFMETHQRVNIDIVYVMFGQTDFPTDTELQSWIRLYRETR